jgi:hypothetical protein
MVAGAAGQDATATLLWPVEWAQIDEVSMTCEDRRPQPYLTYGGWARPEQGAKDRDFGHSTGPHPGPTRSKLNGRAARHARLPLSLCLLP